MRNATNKTIQLDCNMINYDESPCQLFSQTCVSYGIFQRILTFPSTRFTNSFQADFPMRRRLASEAFQFPSLFPRKHVTTKRFVTIDPQFRSVSRRSRVCPCHLHAKLRCKYFSPFSRVPSSHQLFPFQPVLFPLLSFVLECDSFPSLPVCHSFAPALRSYPSTVVLPNSLLFPFPLLSSPPLSLSLFIRSPRSHHSFFLLASPLFFLLRLFLSPADTIAFPVELRRYIFKRFRKRAKRVHVFFLHRAIRSVGDAGVFSRKFHCFQRKRALLSLNWPTVFFARRDSTGPGSTNVNEFTRHIRAAKGKTREKKLSEMSKLEHSKSN